MKLTPIVDGVLVRLDPFEETFGADSKLVRPDIAKEKPVWGVVLGVSALATRSVHVGDRVCVPWRTGHDLKISGRLCVKVAEDQILAVDDGDNG
jgi:co-chaperonin GroES (HSP10)